MLQFYVGVIRSVLEYAVAAWHTCLNLEMSDQLELLQKRALRIIYGGSRYPRRARSASAWILFSLWMYVCMFVCMLAL